MTRRAFAAIAAMLLILLLHTGLLSAQAVRLPSGDVPLSAPIRTSFTIGAEEGRHWEVFAGVGDMAFDSRENLYVLDRGNARVVVFDPAGRFLRVIGRRGNGPGEIAVPQRMTVTRQDEVVVSDVARRALSVFGTDGVFRRTIPFAQGSVISGSRLAPHARGGVVSLFLHDLASGRPRQRVLWQPLGGAAATSLFTPPAGASRAAVFAPVTRFALLAGGGLAVASTEAYSVSIIGPNGSTQRVLQRAISPRRVTARDRQRVRERRETLARPGGHNVVGGGALPASVRAGAVRQAQDVEFAAVMPVIQALETDAAGNLWIQREGRTPGSPGPIDIVTAQGRYVGTLSGVRLPTAFSARGRAAYVQKDELGVERVVVVQLPPRWR